MLGPGELLSVEQGTNALPINDRRNTDFTFC